MKVDDLLGGVKRSGRRTRLVVPLAKRPRGLPSVRDRACRDALEQARGEPHSSGERRRRDAGGDHAFGESLEYGAIVKVCGLYLPVVILEPDWSGIRRLDAMRVVTLGLLLGVEVAKRWPQTRSQVVAEVHMTNPAVERRVVRPRTGKDRDGRMEVLFVTRLGIRRRRDQRSPQ